MNALTFEENQNFTLRINGWGEANPKDIIKLLDNVIENFYENLKANRINNKKIIVSKSKNCVPQIIKRDKLNCIYLSSKDKYWSHYAYQFSHELCHHIIDKKYSTTVRKFDWFEEVICELASIFTLKKMSKTWQEKPPYPRWKSYSQSLNEYVKNILSKKENKITEPFKVWLSQKLKILYKERYNRDFNRIIAVQMYPLFENKPELWESIQYLKEIEIGDETDLNIFFDKWNAKLPKELNNNFKKLKEIFI